jgi:isopenicillin-N epimerase
VDELPGELRRTADRLAAVVGAQGRDLVWVDNATTGANAVLGSVEFEPGDEIAVCDHIYGAVRNAALHLAGRAGARVVEARVPFPIAGPEDVITAFASVLSDRTRLVIADHVTSWSGLVLPVEAIVRMAHERGIPVLVDGAHAPGMFPLALDALGADYYVGNCHKWLFAPKGCGFLWARRDRQEGLHPVVISHGWGRGFLEEFDWTGTRDPSAFLALQAALDFVDELGLPQINAHNDALAAAAAAYLADRWQVAIPSPAAMRRSLCTLPVATFGATDAAAALALHKALQQRSVQVPVWSQNGALWLRISAQIHNRASDYERLADALINVNGVA